MKLAHVAVGCNQVHESAAWGALGTVAYGAHNGIVVFTPADRSKGVSSPVVHGVLSGVHKSRVNCITWAGSHEELLVSGASDGSLAVWAKEQDDTHGFRIGATLSGHSGAVNNVATQPHPDGGVCVVSASSDMTVRVWRYGYDGDVHNCTQEISLGKDFALCVALGTLSGNVPVLAWGGSDQHVHLLTCQPGGDQFVPAVTLSGHEDWVRGVSFCEVNCPHGGAGKALLLASGSQDTHIRLWRIGAAAQARTEADEPSPGDDMLSTTALRVSQRTFGVKSDGETRLFVAQLDALLMGHENWVSSVQWQARVDGRQSSSLLSTSMDKTLIIWQLDPDEGIWVEGTRLGSVGGNTLGLFGGCSSPDGRGVIAHGYQGSLHQWERVDSESAIQEWHAQVVVGGHFKAVVDIDWDPTGSYIVSASADQTSRLLSRWVHSDSTTPTWHEIARPQVHGYDMRCICTVSSTQFVSGADEKVIRVFDAPGNFLDTVSHIRGVELAEEGQARAVGASVPALGLSNKAVFSNGGGSAGAEEGAAGGEEVHNPFREEDSHPFQQVTLTEPPFEEHLTQNTLWPETQKLYGHGYGSAL